MAIDVVSSHPHSPSVPRRCRSNSSANCSGVTLRLRPKADISHASIVPIRPYLQTLRPHGFGMTLTEWTTSGPCRARVAELADAPDSKIRWLEWWDGRDSNPQSRV